MKLLQDAAGDRGGRRTLRPLFGDCRFSGPAGITSCHPCHRGTPECSSIGGGAQRGASPSGPLIRGTTRSWGFHSYIMP